MFELDDILRTGRYVSCASMPSIEIICIDQVVPPILPDYGFALQFESELRSHREPKPLFAKDFQELKGYIYHLGSPHLKTQQATFFAYDLIENDDEPVFRLRFIDPFVDDVKSLLNFLILQSPSHQIVFTSDWQFAELEAERKGPISITEFWKLHDSNVLRFNTLYRIEGET